MSKAFFMTGNVLTRERIFTVENHQDGTAAAVFKKRHWLVFTKKDKRIFYVDQAIEKVAPNKLPSYVAYFDNKTGQQLKLSEVFTGGIEQTRLQKIRDAQTVLQAEKNIDKSYDQDKILDRFMIAIALIMIMLIFGSIGMYYMAIAINNLAAVMGHIAPAASSAVKVP